MAIIEIPQVTYSNVPAAAFPGMLADSGPWDIESALAEVPLDAGLGVMVGATTGPTPTVKLPSASGDLAKFKGIACYEAARMPTGNANRFKVSDPISCVTQGRVWVQVDATAGGDMVDEGPVYWVFTGANAGKFRGDAGSGPSAVLVPNAKCKIGGSAGSVAMIKINLP